MILSLVLTLVIGISLGYSITTHWDGGDRRGVALTCLAFVAYLTQLYLVGAP